MGLPVKVAAGALLMLAANLHAQDIGSDWPEGSSMHTLHMESKRLDSAHAALSDAHAGLLARLERMGGGAPVLAGEVALHHERWVAYRKADCELSGTLTGAGGAWPAVHGLTCERTLVENRARAMDGVRRCLEGLPPGHARFEQLECLEGLVDGFDHGY